MKTYICVAIAVLGLSNAINLNTLNKSEVHVDTYDGPTNGTMTDDEKDTLI